MEAPSVVEGITSLQVYLHGAVAFDAALAFQRRQVYQTAAAPSVAALLLCEHPPMISVGREGSRAHILYEPRELHARQWDIRWVNRGGGCILHLPGQLAIYAVLNLKYAQLCVPAYLQRLTAVVAATLADLDVQAHTRAGRAGVWVGERPIAMVGVAVRDWVAYYGAVLNISTPLDPYRRMRGPWGGDGPMTSLERERRGPLRVAHVREQLIEHFATVFEIPRTTLLFDHPALGRKAYSNAVAAGR